MPTLIDRSTTPESVVALVSTWRYFKYDLEVSIHVLKKHRDWVRKHRDRDGLSYQEVYDLITNLEDILDRGTALERKTFPEDFPRKKSTSLSNTEPSSNEPDYEFAEMNI